MDIPRLDLDGDLPQIPCNYYDTESFKLHMNNFKLNSFNVLC